MYHGFFVLLQWIEVTLSKTYWKKKKRYAYLVNGNLKNVILLVFILLYTNKIAVIAPCKRNRIETKSVF